MTVIALGINHKAAPVEIREQASVLPEKVPQFLHTLKNNGWATGAVILSTCNRTEFYIDDLTVPVQDFFALWTEHAKISMETIEQYHYYYENNDAVAHLLRVTAGLDSLILGEPQIMGQLRNAFEYSKQADALCKTLNRLFQLAFQTAKKIRTETNIGAYTISVAYTAVQMAKQIFDLSEQRALLVGAGETIELVAEHLIEANIQSLAIANRTESRAKEMSARLAIPSTVHPLEAIPELLEKADIVIASTGAPFSLISKEMAARALKARRNKPILMVDIAVPRDIDANVNELDDIYLYSVDDLNKIVEKNYQSREAAAKEAETYIQRSVSEWDDWLQLADLSVHLQAIFHYVDEQKGVTLRKAKQLTHREQTQPMDDVIDQVVTQMSNRVLHPLINLLKTLEQEGDSETVNKILAHYTAAPKHKIR
ncbi:glutamyl-tRNA reductase [Wohlfahrtiimonas chitiniclastica]|uniref:glutamyl-tRNA reductase n=1 Tax=Wohlfahrtiimonas chitiniclastica TaxID=400946 RepID=UPI0009D94EE3|nr:glutamyl-tRNA reductase [Wohlfahrtiimonas chitiniclastica]